MCAVDLLVSASKGAPAAPQTDLAVLESTVRDVMSMLDRVISHVSAVVRGEEEGNVAVGRYLMDTLAAAAPALEKGQLEHVFNAHLQVRTRSSTRLALTQAGYPHAELLEQSCTLAGGGIVAARALDLERFVSLAVKNAMAVLHDLIIFWTRR